MSSSSSSFGILRRQLSIEVFRGRKPSLFWPRVVFIVLFSMDGPACVATLRIGQAFQRSGYKFLAKRMRRRDERRFQCYINPRVTIGDGLRLAHPVGIVIGNGATIGERCAIYQNVTLGGVHAGDWHDGLHPKVGDDVRRSAGCVLSGDITVGSNVSVGANAVVRANVPDGHTAVGVPARLIPPKIAA